MKIFQTLFWFILLSIPALLIYGAIQAVEKKPNVIATAALTPAKIERAKALLKEHDPRRLKNNERKTLSLNAAELTLIANHLIQRFGSGGAEVKLAQGAITSSASVQLPGKQSPLYFNIDADLIAIDGSLSWQRLKIGKLNVAPVIADKIGAFVLLHIYRNADIPHSSDLIERITVSPRQLSISYQWQESLIAAVRERLISKQDIARLKHYNQAMVDILADAPNKFALETVVEQLAAQVPTDGDPVAENRALIITLSNYVNGRRMTGLIPEIKQWPSPKRVKLISHSRHDLAQHFATSAALAVTAGGQLSDAIGLFKEIDDSDGGSGFSFKDLAADRAGTQFGQLAVASRQGAQQLHAALAAGIKQNDLIPSLSGLEENMTEGQFKARYGGVNDSKYLAVVADIDKRIKASPLFE